VRLVASALRYRGTLEIQEVTAVRGLSRLFDGQDTLYRKWTIEAVTQESWEGRDDGVESKERREGQAAFQEDIERLIGELAYAKRWGV
jgi:hypothetical protein